MTVYVIAQLKMTDRAAYDRYQARFFDVFRKFNGRLLSADESPSVVEGDWNRDKLVLMSFPDETAYRARADSPEYLEISKDRKAGAQSHRAAREGIYAAGLKQVDRYHHQGPTPTPMPKPNGKGAAA
jgi:uncharacterized protein (DUF1330 family)